MDRAEAIEILAGRCLIAVDEDSKTAKDHERRVNEAIDLAIEALQKEMYSDKIFANYTKNMNIAPKQKTVPPMPNVKPCKGDAESARTTDCISRADTIKAMCAECWWESVCGGDCIEVAVVKGMPSCNQTCNQKQITGKLESAEIATSEGEESTMGQPNSKLDCISRQAVIELIKESYYDLSEMDEVWAFVADVEELQPVTPTERTGEWIGLDECSVCGKQAYGFIEGCVEGVEYLPNFCPNCGAKMKGGTENE